MPRRSSGRSRELNRRDTFRPFPASRVRGVIAEAPRYPVSDKDDFFARYLTGFSRHATVLLTRYFSEHIERLDEEEIALPLRFTGMSEKPKKTATLNKTSIFETRSGVLILSGTVAAPDRVELGVGSSKPVARLDAPSVSSHDSPGRFNIELGDRPKDIGTNALSSAVMPQLDISRVVEINGQEVGEHMSPQTIDGMWRNAVRSTYYW